jgi:hypothetical protein
VLRNPRRSNAERSEASVGRRKRSRAIAEPLELRVLLTTYTVTNTSDSGPGSLRQAILNANANPGADTILFNIPGSGVQTIAPLTDLPAISDPVTIAGTTQPGYRPNTLTTGDNEIPPIHLRGTAGATHGLIVQAANSVVEGFTIDGFYSAGVVLEGTADALYANFIGMDPAGLDTPATQFAGVRIDGGIADTIGGSAGANGNLISRNVDGIFLVGGASSNIIRGNLIGTDTTGVNAAPNLEFGVYIGDGSQNMIGGRSIGQGNTISWNGPSDPSGVAPAVAVNSGTGNTIVGNSIFSNGMAIDLAPQGPNPNTPGGPHSGPNELQNYPVLSAALGSASGTSVSGTLNSAATSSFTLDLYATPYNTNPVTTTQYYLGSQTVATDASGNANFSFTTSTSVPPDWLIAATATDSTGDTSEFSPTVSVTAQVLTVTNVNDSGPGSLRQALADANAYPNAYPDEDLIRFSIPGSGIQTIVPQSPLPIITDSVTLDATSQPGYAGTPLIELRGGSLQVVAPRTTIEGLLLDGNSTGPALTLSGAGRDVVQANEIGGSAFPPNETGILITSSYNTIGGTSAAARNIISGNGTSLADPDSAGIVVQGAGASHNTIQGNLIGTDATGSLAVSNVRGIEVVGAAATSIQGTAADPNVISDNSRGIDLEAGATGTDIEGNLIGLDAKGDAALGNGTGVYIADSSANLIGVATTNPNTISGNLYGVYITGSSTGNSVSGNYIGTDPTGLTALGNTTVGIFIAAGANIIGSTAANGDNVISGNALGIDISGAPAIGNLIQNDLIGVTAIDLVALSNSGDGVRIEVNAANNIVGGTATNTSNVIANNGGTGVDILSGTGNSVLGNTIYANGRLGIDLGGDGVTLNDSQGHNGPNLLEDFPVITSAVTSNAVTTIAGSVSGPASSQLLLQFFADDTPDSSGYGQGQFFAGSTSITTDPSGKATFTFTPTLPLTPGQVATATATDATGNTSEFAADQVVTDPDSLGPMQYVRTSLAAQVGELLINRDNQILSSYAAEPDPYTGYGDYQFLFASETAVMRAVSGSRYAVPGWSAFSDWGFVFQAPHPGLSADDIYAITINGPRQLIKDGSAYTDLTNPSISDVGAIAFDGRVSISTANNLDFTWSPGQPVQQLPMNGLNQDNGSTWVDSSGRIYVYQQLGSSGPFQVSVFDSSTGWSNATTNSPDPTDSGAVYAVNPSGQFVFPTLSGGRNYLELYNGSTFVRLFDRTGRGQFANPLFPTVTLSDQGDVLADLNSGVFLGPTAAMYYNHSTGASLSLWGLLPAGMTGSLNNAMSYNGIVLIEGRDNASGLYSYFLYDGQHSPTEVLSGLSSPIIDPVVATDGTIFFYLQEATGRYSLMKVPPGTGGGSPVAAAFTAHAQMDGPATPRSINASMAASPAAPSPAPTATAVVTSPTQVLLKWTYPAYNQTGFSIERSTDGTKFSVIATFDDPSIGSYTDTGLSSSQIYYYRVRATLFGGFSPYSNTTYTAFMFGTVFNDTNDNGSFDGAETGAAGVVMYLDLNHDGILDTGDISTTTDASGAYQFTALPAGTYTLRELPPSGFAITSPIGYSKLVTVVDGQSAFGGFFGQVQVSTVPMDSAYQAKINQNLGRPGTFSMGDVNGDGMVNAADLLVLQENFGHPIDALINGTSGSDAITLVQDNDLQHIDWKMGNASGQILIDDSNGMTINGNGGSDTITLDYTNGNPLPNALHLNGTFTINGLQGTDPLAGTTLDIGKSTVFISYGGSDPIAAIKNYLQAGYNSGAWNGSPTATTGVITSAAAQDNANHNTAIGYADSTDGQGINTVPNTIELTYTLYCDANLDHQVNSADLQILLGNLNRTGAWDQADFNYDGQVNSADLQALLFTLNTSLGSQATPVGVAAVAAAPGATAPVPAVSHSSVRQGIPTPSIAPAGAVTHHPRPAKPHAKRR